MRRWASLKQTKSTFQRLPVQNNIQLGCHQLNLEQSPHIPYDETGDWNGIGKIWLFPYEGAASIGERGWKVITRACIQFGGNLIWNSMIKLASG